MENLFDVIRQDLLNPKSLVGALFYGAIFIGLATVVAAVIRRAARRVEPRLTDVTALRFVTYRDYTSRIGGLNHWLFVQEEFKT